MIPLASIIILGLTISYLLLEFSYESDEGYVYPDADWMNDVRDFKN